MASRPAARSPVSAVRLRALQIWTATGNWLSWPVCRSPPWVIVRSVEPKRIRRPRGAGLFICVRRALSAPVRLAFVALALSVAAFAQQPLTDEQVAAAIALGKSGAAPVVRVGASRDFDVTIAGPIGRIAAAAAYAVKQFRPFEPANVTPAMRAPTFVVTVVATYNSRYLGPTRIVLQRKDAKGVEGAISPISQEQTLDVTALGRDATFDRLPDGEFDVVVVTTDTPQRFAVSAQMRAKIR